MKILIVSDTHRSDENLKLVIRQHTPLDMQMEMVLGNNDFFSMLDREREIEIVGHKILLTHGHYYGVSMGPEGLADEARSRGCDMAMFGHTHKPFLGEIGGVMVLNPGSLSYPRQEGRRPS